MTDRPTVQQENPTPTAVDGVAVARFVEPGSASEIAAVLADASEQGQGVIPIGGGTLIGLGNPPERADTLLSTRKLNQVIAHEPADLTLSVGAGTTLGDLQRVLGEQGQWLPIEAPLPDASTIGGLIATAFTSPRKFGSDGLRDLLVGISVAHPHGAVTKAGGTVVKNVTGFDMMRLYHGSLGTLGVIVSANFKVLPRPRAEATWEGAFASLDAALAAATTLLTLRGRPVAIDVISDRASEWRLLARYEGREPTVKLMVDEASNAAGSPIALLEADASKDRWQALVDRLSSGRIANRLVVRTSTRPRQVAALAEAVRDGASGFDGPGIQVSPGLGRVDLIAGTEGRNGADLQALIDRVGGVADSIVLHDAPSAWKTGRDVWSADPLTLDIMQSLKNEFDPDRVLNPGRFAGSI